MDTSPSQPPPIPPATPAPARRGWWSRNWKWFVPTGCLTIFLLFAIFAGTIVLTVFTAIKSTDVYKTALARAKADPRVIEAIGTPIKEAWYVIGKSEVSGGSGTAELAMPISGPKGKAMIYCNSSKDSGEWKFNKLTVKIDATSQIIDLSDRRTKAKAKANEEPEDEAEEKDDDPGGE